MVLNREPEAYLINLNFDVTKNIVRPSGCVYMLSKIWK
jgi:hypothetical protein